MAYCRKGPDSDVYVYFDGKGWHIEVGPVDEDAKGRISITLQRLSETREMLLALRDHGGWKVPDEAIERIDGELARVTLLVATYFWQPDEGSKFANPYTSDDVRRLQRMVAKHMTVPHKFAVITDQPALFINDADIRAIPIDRSTHVPGTCFVRLMTFSPHGKELFAADKLLQLDLDTLIVGNIDHLVARDENLVMWHNPTRHPSRPNRSIYNTSLLLHRLGTWPELWQCFMDMKRDGDPLPAKDDQWYLSDVLGPDMPYFDSARDGVYRIARADTPGSGVDGALPDNACIVFFTGSNGKWTNPEVWDANPWIELYLDA